MGLAVSVGSLAWCLKNGYTEDAGLHREDIREVNRVLGAHSLAPHVEPETVPDLVSRSRLRGMPYSWLHYLRRAIAFAPQAPEGFTPVADGQDPAEDLRIDREYSIGDCHLICHSDCGGYYVPLDFPEPLYDDRDGGPIGGMLGSSQQALRELIQVAPLLGIRLKDGVPPDAVWDEINNEDGGPLFIERKVWLLLFECFSHSIEYGAAVEFH